MRSNESASKWIMVLAELSVFTLHQRWSALVTDTDTSWLLGRMEESGMFHPLIFLIFQVACFLPNVALSSCSFLLFDLLPSSLCTFLLLCLFHYPCSYILPFKLCLLSSLLCITPTLCHLTCILPFLFCFLPSLSLCLIQFFSFLIPCLPSSLFPPPFLLRFLMHFIFVSFLPSFAPSFFPPSLFHSFVSSFLPSFCQ